MNTKLLLRVKNRILKEPAQFIMADGISTRAGDGDLPRKIPNCGTACCIAGWAVTLAAKKLPKNIKSKSWFGYVEKRAQNILELNAYQRAGLFYLTHWPLHYRTAWKAASTLEGRAQIAADRIDHFIATDGAE